VIELNRSVAASMVEGPAARLAPIRLRTERRRAAPQRAFPAHMLWHCASGTPQASKVP